ncbi:MAG: hypothetical protein EZS28_034506 [Streblomastix strix]|uniref:Uncharacterized protein n=1 Tax=Streblomastix strix TaxID=222440 RepID=A0A5J4UGZ1_9EUKA|nr:MAG: hypothetical protein EZS28_034506 [Streblomastix strix]
MQAAMGKRRTAAVSLCLLSPPTHSRIHVLFQVKLRTKLLAYMKYMNSLFYNQLLSASEESKQANFSYSIYSGRLLYAIQNAHNEITSVITFYFSDVTISGDSQYQVRVIKICRDGQQLVATMKELRMIVTIVHITYDSLECAISRSDGQMLSQQLTHYIRLKQMIESANFHGMGNLQVKLQLIASGSGLFSVVYRAAPQSTNSAALFVTIISAPNDFYNQGSIHQCDVQMIQTILSKHL